MRRCRLGKLWPAMALVGMSLMQAERPASTGAAVGSEPAWDSGTMALGDLPIDRGQDMLLADHCHHSHHVHHGGAWSRPVGCSPGWGVPVRFNSFYLGVPGNYQQYRVYYAPSWYAPTYHHSYYGRYGGGCHRGW